LTQLAELGSPIALGLLSLGVSYALAELIVAYWEKRILPWRLAALQVGLVALALVYGGLRLAALDRATAAAPKGRVGLVQANMGLFEKRMDRGEGLRRHLALSESLKAEGPLDLIVWSETSVAGGVYEADAARVCPAH
jgi:apolipoprotein N-acyltransferase